MVEWKKLGEVCEIKGRIGFRGYTRDDQVIQGEGAISLSPGNISDGVLCYDTCTYITWSKYEESPEIMVQDGDIILCKTASVGKVARVNHLPEKATINPQLVLIKNIEINPQFLYYVLADNPFQSRIKGLAGVGSVPNVSQAKLASISIPVPSLSEQSRIVGILDTFTASIENLKQQIAQRRKQYEHYREQLLDLEGKEGVEIKTIGEVCKTITPPKKLATKNYQLQGLFPIIDQGQSVIVGYTDDESALVPNGEYVLFGDHTRFVKFYKGRFAQGADGLKILKVKDFVSSRYFYFAFSNAEVPSRGYSRHWSIAKELPIPVPSITEQQRIVSILDTFEASIANLEQQLVQRERQYEYYRNKLLTFE